MKFIQVLRTRQLRVRPISCNLEEPSVTLKKEVIFNKGALSCLTKKTILEKWVSKLI